MACRRREGMLPLLLALAILILPLKWLAAAVFAALVHEIGHYLALRLCKVEILQFRAGYSGMRMEIGQITRQHEFICALAGPAAGLLLLFFARWLPRCAVCGCIQSVYNLLPIYPMDGGRALRCMGLGNCVCAVIEIITLLSLGAVGLYGSFCLKLGIVPIILSAATIQRALEGKGLAKRIFFRYNRERICE